MHRIFELWRKKFFFSGSEGHPTFRKKEQNSVDVTVNISLTLKKISFKKQTCSFSVSSKYFRILTSKIINCVSSWRMDDGVDGWGSHGQRKVCRKNNCCTINQTSSFSETPVYGGKKKLKPLVAGHSLWTFSTTEYWNRWSWILFLLKSYQ